MGCLCRRCSNITVINAAFHPSRRRKSPETASCPSANAPAQFDLIVARLEPEKLLPGTVNNHPPFPCHEIAIGSEHLMFNTSINLTATVLFFGWEGGAEPWMHLHRSPAATYKQPSFCFL